MVWNVEFYGANAPADVASMCVIYRTSNSFAKKEEEEVKKIINDIPLLGLITQIILRRP